MAQAKATPSVRPFTIETPEADLEDLRARIAATRWPEKETVEDDSQGVPLALMQDLARYWATHYDWRCWRWRQIVHRWDLYVSLEDRA